MKEGPVPTIAERIFDADRAKSELEDDLEAAGIECGEIGWDEYDCSLELLCVGPDARLSIDAQRAVHAAGFAKCYVNHTDKWETHYTFNPAEPFAECKGWRVSYPHKRSDGRPGIYVEAAVDSWPKDWFESGYAVIKEAT